MLNQFRDVFASLQKHEVKYVVIGGIAAVLHGVPRALEVLAGILANDPFATLAEVLDRFYKQQDVARALIEENYKRLDSSARRVIEALAVFRRPVRPLAADYLLEPFVPGLDVPGIIRPIYYPHVGFVR